MENILNYIKPELLVVAIALYFIGEILKTSQVNDTKIPLILGVIGVVLSVAYVIAKSTITNYQDVIMCLFTGVTQGFIVAGISVYCKQLIIQSGKIE